MKPEEFANSFIETAKSMGLELTQSGNIIVAKGKNISPGKAATMFRRYGTECAKCPSREFRQDPNGLKQFRIIAEKALG